MESLTLAQRTVLNGVTAKPRTAREIRDAIHLPRTTSALDNVQAVLAQLVEVERIVRIVQPTGPSRYVRA